MSTNQVPLEIRSGELDDIEATARTLLPTRTPEIVDGRLGGEHWFVAIMREAAAIVRRRRLWATRRP